MQEAGEPYVHEVSVVVPVYQGEATLKPLVDEIVPLLQTTKTPAGNLYRVIEILLVNDNGPDNSAGAIRQLAASQPAVRPVWLSRNFGQHAATLAGIASSGGAWVVTMDEDGQHAPADIGLLVDTAITTNSPLVYGQHEGEAPHARWRNITSAIARRMGRWMSGADMESFSSFRLILGTHARAVAAYCGPRIYLDSALRWAIGSSENCTVSTRPRWRDESGYSFGRLLSHFWTLVLSSGTRPLRIVTFLGMACAVLGFGGAAWIIFRQLTTDFNAPGWASMTVALLVTTGLILFALGVVAEYVGALLRTVQGRPLYIVLDDPNDGPLGEAARQ
ncbi:MAG TPA: glycosyltransferase [Ilumatobacteraceae bacterium]|nr:glycosyltransferase [Ilumatobacteraceae bacterium]